MPVARNALFGGYLSEENINPFIPVSAKTATSQVDLQVKVSIFEGKVIIRTKLNLLQVIFKIVHHFQRCPSPRPYFSPRGNPGLKGLTHSTLRVSPEIVVWIFNTFDKNFGIKNDFTKYLKESCWLCSDPHFSFKYFSKNAFAWKILPKLSCYFGCHKHQRVN